MTPRLALALSLLAGCAIALPAPAAAATPWRTAAQELPDLVATLLPSVVNVSIVHLARPAEATTQGAATTRPTRRRSVGSGFIIDPAGLILTNRHVVENAAEITVTFHDGRSLPATLVVAAAVVDLAILRVTPERPLVAAKWGDSFTLRQGTPVIAIGNPLGYSSTVTSGIVSALDRDIKASTHDHFVQTDAAINPGNSGGPLFNLDGEVIGVNTAIATTGATAGSVGIGFAIPSNDAQFVVNRLLQFDRVRLGWLPVRVQRPTPSIASALGLERARGVIVTDVDATRPALAAALAPGDVILDVDGEEVHDARTFNRALGVQIVGTTTPLSVWRDGKRIAVPVQIENNPQDLRMPTMQAAAAKAPARPDALDLGLNLAALDDAARTRAGLQGERTGVAIATVDPISQAAEQGAQPGDVILRVGRDPVNSVRAFWYRVEQARLAGQSRILLLVHGPDGERWIVVPTG
jgi:serine protease Do